MEIVVHFRWYDRISLRLGTLFMGELGAVFLVLQYNVGKPEVRINY